MQLEAAVRHFSALEHEVALPDFRALVTGPLFAPPPRQSESTIDSVSDINQSARQPNSTPLGRRSSRALQSQGGAIRRPDRRRRQTSLQSRRSLE